MKAKKSFLDRTRERYVVIMADDNFLTWNHDDWNAVSWIVDGRTDTNFEAIGGHPYVFFYLEEDANIAVWAINKHHAFQALLSTRFRAGPAPKALTRPVVSDV